MGMLPYSKFSHKFWLELFIFFSSMRVCIVRFLFVECKPHHASTRYQFKLVYHSRYKWRELKKICELVQVINNIQYSNEYKLLDDLLDHTNSYIHFHPSKYLCTVNGFTLKCEWTNKRVQASYASLKFVCQLFKWQRTSALNTNETLNVKQKWQIY